uniref:diphosphomevalonate decarboxylase n=1 Tax=Hydrogenovibrio crunogenus (strain DSM 25203 / XCL-2) TaxID=317025 RepID=Q31EU7_HYDCU
MKNKQRDFVDQIIPHRTPTQKGTGKAPVNIALSKYWGKRNVDLNLPTNSSLSISLPGLGTKTQIEWVENQSDHIYLNETKVASDDSFAQRIRLFLDLFRPNTQGGFIVNTLNSVPTAAGLASSASGYAALVLALNDCFQWDLPLKRLSLLARLGSGSASRSLYDGFALWHKGQLDNGMDSYAEKIDQAWPELCIGLLEIDVSTKPISSTQGMQNTVNHCELYQAWPDKAEADLQKTHQAIQDKDFQQLGQTSENNALAMHATMIATWPPILYWQPESVAAMHKVWQLRAEGCDVYFTMDAGPNLKLLFLKQDAPMIQTHFPSIKVIQPFSDT